MNPLWGHAMGVLILLMMAVFIGIWIWAWLPRHKPVFGRLACLPMEDGPDRDPSANVADAADADVALTRGEAGR